MIILLNQMTSSGTSADLARGSRWILIFPRAAGLTPSANRVSFCGGKLAKGVLSMAIRTAIIIAIAALIAASVIIARSPVPLGEHLKTYL